MVTGKRSDGFSVTLGDGKHKWISGLDTASGGNDEAPDPHRLLESALASCTILTVQLYAARKGWPLDGTEAKVEITAEGEAGNRLRREVKFLGPLSEEQRVRLLEIAEKCPIHRFLERGAVIETELLI